MEGNADEDIHAFIRHGLSLHQQHPIIKKALHLTSFPWIYREEHSGVFNQHSSSCGGSNTIEFKLISYKLFVKPKN